MDTRSSPPYHTIHQHNGRSHSSPSSYSSLTSFASSYSPPHHHVQSSWSSYPPVSYGPPMNNTTASTTTTTTTTTTSNATRAASSSGGGGNNGSGGAGGEVWPSSPPPMFVSSGLGAYSDDPALPYLPPPMGFPMNPASTATSGHGSTISGSAVGDLARSFGPLSSAPAWGPVSESRTSTPSPHLRPMAISPTPPDLPPLHHYHHHHHHQAGSSHPTQPSHSLPSTVYHSSSLPSHLPYSLPPRNETHDRSTHDYSDERYCSSRPNPFSVGPTAQPLRPTKRRKREVKEEKQRAVVITDENGNRSLKLPATVETALDNNDWDQVSTFLSDNSETLFPSYKIPPLPCLVPTSPCSSPQDLSPRSSDDGSSPRSHPDVLTAGGSDTERLHGILSIRIEERMRIYNNVNVVMTSDINVRVPCSVSPLVPQELRAALQPSCGNGGRAPEEILKSTGTSIEASSHSSSLRRDVSSDSLVFPQEPHLFPPSGISPPVPIPRVISSNTSPLACLPSATRADPCIMWKGPFRKAKGRCYPIISFPQLKIYNMPVMKLLLCWKYPAEARRHELMSPSFRKVISNTCGNPACLEERHCRIKAVFEQGRFL
eukprot:TRINITY_DN4892_c0_g2_i1.p1 TRINITY_DN4892_c0_g2~~TRINITY_DN4892_c0_g2_i1.p1  ORF type:complete len:600 (+),score=58.90 TRINITY_DN4892_c0_g2_i1:379-2178(+)